MKFHVVFMPIILRPMFSSVLTIKIKLIDTLQQQHKQNVLFFYLYIKYYQPTLHTSCAVIVCSRCTKSSFSAYQAWPLSLMVSGSSCVSYLKILYPLFNSLWDIQIPCSIPMSEFFLFHFYEIQL